MDKALAAPGIHRPFLERAERRRLLRALNELCEERETWPRGDELHAEALPEHWPLAARLNGEDEQLVARLRAGLAKLAGSLRGEPFEAAAAVHRALDGAESVMRRDCARGQSGRLPQLLPSFAYLVVLPLGGPAEALRVSERAARLLATAP